MHRVLGVNRVIDLKGFKSKELQICIYIYVYTEYTHIIAGK